HGRYGASTRAPTTSSTSRCGSTPPVACCPWRSASLRRAGRCTSRPRAPEDPRRVRAAPPPGSAQAEAARPGLRCELPEASDAIGLDAAEPEMPRRGGELGERGVGVERARAVLLRELLAVVADDDRHMEIAGCRQAEPLLQADLARGGCRQVGAPHDVGDPGRAVVDDDRELVGPDPVRAKEDEVAAALRQRLDALDAVGTVEP